MSQITNASAIALRLVEGVDRGMDATVCRDVFDFVADGVPVLRITFDYDGAGAGVETAECRSLIKGVRAWQIPFVMNGIHLCGLLLNDLADWASESGAEFFADLFIDDEGNRRDIAIDMKKWGVA